MSLLPTATSHAYDPSVFNNSVFTSDSVMALSPIPFYVFGVMEPALQIIGFTVASFGPHLIALTQTPTPISHNLLPSEKIITYQFGNLLLLIAILSLSFITTANDAAVASTYLSALWGGDLGHIGVTAWCMGERMLHVGEWTLVNWASLVFPVFLFIMRTLYFAGAF